MRTQPSKLVPILGWHRFNVFEDFLQIWAEFRMLAIFSTKSRPFPKISNRAARPKVQIFLASRTVPATHPPVSSNVPAKAFFVISTMPRLPEKGFDSFGFTVIPPRFSAILGAFWKIQDFCRSAEGPDPSKNGALWAFQLSSQLPR